MMGIPRKTDDTTSAPPPDTLGELRAELDAIDWELLRALSARIACCIKIAHHKRDQGIALMQPNRIRIVHERASEFGKAHGIDTDFLRKLYDLIIAETCRVEDAIMKTQS